MLRFLKIVFLGLVLFLSGCASQQGSPLPSGATITNTFDTGSVGTYVSNEDGFNTSTYWIVGPRGVILIDTQFLLSAANEAVNQIQKITGKPVVLAIVLHPNPDKFNGTSVLQKRGIRVVTSQQVLDLIPAVHRDRHYWFYDRFKPDYPDEAPQPESFGDASIALGAGGITVNVEVVGPGASAAHVLVRYNKHIFVGDLIANRHHAWLEIGKIPQWLERLSEIKAFKPQFVHPGRGASGGTELIANQIKYLNKVSELIAQEHPRMPVDEMAIGKIKDKLTQIYRGYGNEYFLEVGLPAEWVRQAKAAKVQ